MMLVTFPGHGIRGSSGDGVLTLLKGKIGETKYPENPHKTAQLQED